MTRLDQHTVSVVIATRNRPDMVREAVRAAMEQDYPGAVEVVVVFDQSEPDEQLAVQGDRRSVRVIGNTHKPGLAGARNSGIEASSGAFVAFCDDDDLWRPQKLSRQTAALQRYPAAGLATCGITVQYDDQSFDRSLTAELVTFDDLLADRHTELHPSTFLLRKAVLTDRIGLVDEEVPGGFGEDYEFLLRAARVHPVVNVAEPLTVVRWGKQSFFFRRWETMSDGLSWLLRRYPEFEGSRRGSARVRGQIAFAQAAMGHRRASLRWAGQAFRRNPLEPRTPLAVAVALKLLAPDRVMEALHNRGRGI